MEFFNSLEHIFIKFYYEYHKYHRFSFTLYPVHKKYELLKKNMTVSEAILLNFCLFQNFNGTYL